MKKKYSNSIAKYEWIAISIVFCTVIFLTIGYSSHSNDMNINDIAAIVRIQKDIRISDISPTSYTSSAVSNWEEYSVKNIAAGINLPNSDSTITYEIKIVNIGNMEASVSNITGLNSNLKYTLNNYVLRDMICDDNDPSQCKLGTTTTISITIGYNEGGYNSSNTNYTIGMEFEYSYMVDSVAKIGNKYYSTLQSAIDEVPDDKTETTIVLINNTSEAVTIGKNKNIVLNLNDRTLSNNGNTNVIINNGSLKLLGGIITSNASTNGAINNEATGTIVFESGKVIVTGGRQALYNNNGVAYINGSVYLSSSASQRATVQNQKDGKMYITGGIIVSTGMYAVNNLGTLTIGTKDGTANTNYPIFKAVNYGIYSTTNFNFYDGTVKSIIDPFNNVAKITDKEEGFGIINTTEEIDGDTYKTSYLGISKKINFSPNGGTVSETVRYVEVGHEIGTLPTPTRLGYNFIGWFTLASDGEEINEHTIIENSNTYYAHWEKLTDICQMGTTTYASIDEAIKAAPANTQTTITLLKDSSEKIIIESNKNIILDLNGNTITNFEGNPIIETSGTVSILNGTLRTSADQAAINNTDGSLVVNNVTIIATNTKQAMYITGGTVEITGNSYLSSQTSGKPSGSNMERGTVQVISGSLIVTGGTIVGEKQHAISNGGTLTIGTKDGNIDSSTPILIGAVDGIKNDGTLNFYDGIIKGITNSIDGNITDQETNSNLLNGTETINGKNYKTSHLEISE